MWFRWGLNTFTWDFWPISNENCKLAKHTSNYKTIFEYKRKRKRERSIICFEAAFLLRWIKAWWDTPFKCFVAFDANEYKFWLRSAIALMLQCWSNHIEWMHSFWCPHGTMSEWEHYLFLMFLNTHKLMVMIIIWLIQDISSMNEGVHFIYFVFPLNFFYYTKSFLITEGI